MTIRINRCDRDELDTFNIDTIRDRMETLNGDDMCQMYREYR